jgi:hypothetical protein
MRTPRVLISCSHDSKQHEARVLALADRLCADARPDQAQDYWSRALAVGNQLGYARALLIELEMRLARLRGNPQDKS